MEQPKNKFILKHTENADFNQYWYSAYTVHKLVEELEAGCSKAAFLSTPSIFFSLTEGTLLQQSSWLFDFDTQWSSHPHFAKYDYNQPELLPAELLHAFDGVVIDPPFITHEVWAKYAEAAKMLLAPTGKVICSTVPENYELLHELLGVHPVAFKPSIPHLVYQYNFFTNFPPVVLNQNNPEVLDD